MIHYARTIHILMIIIFVAASPALADPATFVEDFTTLTYHDDANTSAYWRTNPGNLTLWNHAFNEEGNYAVNAPRGVMVQGFNLFVLANSTQLHWLDISNPGQPTLLDVLAGFTNVSGLTADAGYLYIADGPAGVKIFELASISTVGTFVTGGGARNIEVVGNLAYIAAGSSGLEIADISNKSVPTWVGGAEISGTAQDLEVRGNYCYLAETLGGLLIIDVSDPELPVVVASYPISGVTSGVVVEGNVAYLSNSNEGLVAVDITDPATPVLLGNMPGTGGWSVAVAGNLAYLGRVDGVLQIDISNPAALAPIDNYGWGTGVADYMDTNGEFLYVSDLGNGLVHAIELLEPSPVSEVASIAPGAVEDVFLAGNILYGVGGTGIYSLDVTDPTNPNTLDSLDLPFLAKSLDVDGDYAYIAAFNGGMHVVDVSDPAAMFIAGNLPQYGADIHGVVEVVGDLCLLGGNGSSDQLQLVDVSDPTNPVQISVLSLWGTPQDIAILGNWAYIALGPDGIDMVDISNPAAPMWAGNYALVSDARSILIDGRVMYIASGIDGFYVYDILNPTSPTYIDELDTSGMPCTGLAISGTYLYTSVDGEGLRMFDVSHPSSITQMPYGIANNASGPRRMAAAGDFVFQATGVDGIDVVQVMSRDFELENNRGQSLVLPGGNEEVFAVRINSQKVGDAIISLSVDDGNIWFYNLDDNIWHYLPFTGSDLKWLAELEQTQAGVNPALSQLEIESAYAYPVIKDVADIANDQGRQVRLTWQFSGYDAFSSSTPIMNYGIYRYIAPGLEPGLGDSSITPKDESSVALAGWDFIAAVPATIESEYSMVVPTLADSNIVDGVHNTVFMVRALSASPTTFFDSPPDSGYSVDNLAPSAPQNLLYDGNELSWDQALENDIKHFTVYGSTIPNWDETAAVIGTTTGTTFDVTGLSFVYYHLTASDFSGNQGEATSTTVVSGVPGPGIATWALHANVPNPFNPSTRISFEVPETNRVSLVIYDLSGRLVRTLVAGEVLPAKRHVRQWNGRDDGGQSVAAGIYFYRLNAGDFSATKRMMLVK